MKVFSLHESFTYFMVVGNILFGILLNIYCYSSKSVLHTINKFCPTAFKANVVLVLFLLFEIFWTKFFFRVSIKSVVLNSGYYWVILLFLPLIYVLIHDGEAQIIRELVFLAAFIQICRFLSWYAYNISGIMVFPEMIGEYSDQWVRSGYKRMLDTCLLGIEFPFLSYLVLIKSNFSKKILPAFMLALCFVFAFIVTASRAMNICCIGTVLLMFTFKRSSLDKRFVRLFVIFVTFAVIFNSSVFQNFLDGILNSSSPNYGTTLIRFQAYTYYLDVLASHWAGGLGFSDGITPYLIQLNHGAGGYFYVSDLGFVGTVIKFGIPGLILIIYTFLLAVNKLKRTAYSVDNILFLGLFVFFFLTGMLSNSIFDTQRVLCYPILLAVFVFDQDYCNNALNE